MGIGRRLLDALSYIRPREHMGWRSEEGAALYSGEPAQLLFDVSDCVEIPSKCEVCLRKLDCNGNWRCLPFVTHSAAHAVHFNCYVRHVRKRTGLFMPWSCPVCGWSCEGAISAMLVNSATRMIDDPTMIYEKHTTWRACRVLAYKQLRYFSASNLSGSNEAMRDLLAYLPERKQMPEMGYPDLHLDGSTPESLARQMLMDAEELEMCGQDHLVIRTFLGSAEMEIIAAVLCKLQQAPELASARTTRAWHMAVAALFATLIRSEKWCLQHDTKGTDTMKARCGCTCAEWKALMGLALSEGQAEWMRYAAPCLSQEYFAEVIQGSGDKLDAEAVTVMLSTLTDFDDKLFTLLTKKNLLHCISLPVALDAVQRYLRTGKVAQAKDVLFAQPLERLKDVPKDQYREMLSCRDNEIQLYLQLFPPREIAVPLQPEIKCLDLIRDVDKALKNQTLRPEIVAASPYAIHFLALLINVEQWGVVQVSNVICVLSANEMINNDSIDKTALRELKELLESQKSMFKTVEHKSKSFSRAYASLRKRAQKG